MLRDNQLERACHVLLGGHLHRRGISWTSDGPSAAARKAFAGDLILSSGEHFLVRIAFAVWNRENQCDLGHALAAMDRERVLKLGALLVALGDAIDPGAAVERWLKRYEQKETVA